jgi:hypothetical protein
VGQRIIRRHGRHGAHRNRHHRPAPIEAIMLAVDAFIASLSPEEFDQLVSRTRG